MLLHKLAVESKSRMYGIPGVTGWLLGVQLSVLTVFVASAGGHTDQLITVVTNYDALRTEIGVRLECDCNHPLWHISKIIKEGKVVY